MLALANVHVLGSPHPIGMLQLSMLTGAGWMGKPVVYAPSRSDWRATSCRRTSGLRQRARQTHRFEFLLTRAPVRSEFKKIPVWDADVRYGVSASCIQPDPAQNKVKVPNLQMPLQAGSFCGHVVTCAWAMFRNRATAAQSALVVSHRAARSIMPQGCAMPSPIQVGVSWLFVVARVSHLLVHPPLGLDGVH